MKQTRSNTEGQTLSFYKFRPGLKSLALRSRPTLVSTQFSLQTLSCRHSPHQLALYSLLLRPVVEPAQRCPSVHPGTMRPLWSSNSSSSSLSGVSSSLLLGFVCSGHLVSSLHQQQQHTMAQQLGLAFGWLDLLHAVHNSQSSTLQLLAVHSA